MRLSPPTTVVWIISTVLVAAVIAIKFFGVNVPVISGNTFEALLAAYALLWLATLVKGL